jgi:hypothetical protein
MKRIFYILTFITIASINNVIGQVKFTATAPNVVAIGEPFVLRYTVTARGKNPHFPDFKDFEVLGGPNMSSSSSISIINGNVSREEKYTYQFYLQANKTGKFTIPPATITVKGKKLTSNSLTIEVVGSQSAAQANNNSKSNQIQEAIPKNNKDLFVRVLVNKTNVYEGEQITATIKIYTREDLAGFDDIKLPNYKGFWADEIPTPDQIQLHRENVNGRIYNVGILKKTILTPQKSGKLKIDPVKITCIVRKRVSSSYDDFFSAFWGGGYKRVKETIKSPTVTINVKPLPPTDDENFYGAVGNFNLDVSIDKTKAKVNDAIKLKVTISGKGNLRLFDAPKVNLPPDFETYDPKETQKIRNTEAGTIGSRTFEYVFIPRHAGNFEIPPIKFTYFDLSDKKYKTLTSDKITLNIEKGEGEESGPLTTAFHKEDIKYLGKDIRYIKQRVKKFYRNPDYYITKINFFLSYLLVLLLSVLIVILRRKQIKENSDLAKVKNKRALKIAKKRLKNAEIAMKKQDEKTFYEEIAKALWQLLSDKLNIPVADLNKDNAQQKLEEQGVDKELIEKYLSLIEDADFQRFAPESQKIDMKDFYKKASDLIIKMNQKIG